MAIQFLPPGMPLRKRLFDLALTIPLIVIFTPVMLVVALVILIVEGPPVVFFQARPGYHGRIFNIIKFRTMRNAVDRHGRLLPDEERLSRLGQFLRSTSLDELPELIHVLKGEMSLVGPRPLLVQYLERYTPEQARRHDVMPGMTGWAQVNGRNSLTWEDKFRLDVWYVDHWSLLLDVKIMFLTFFKVIRREGITSPGQSTNEEFQGEDTFQK